MGDFNTGNINNIANIKIGNVQVNNVFMGTQGIWTNKLANQYTITQELKFDGNYSGYNDHFLGMSNYVNCSTDGTNYSTAHQINGTSNNHTMSVNGGWSYLTQTDTFTDTIFKSNINRLYLNNDNVHFNYNTSASYYQLGYTPQHTYITNGAMSGSVVLKDTPLNEPITLTTTSLPKISELSFYMSDLAFAVMSVDDVGGLYLHLNMSIKIESGTAKGFLNSNSRFNIPCIGANINLVDDTGLVSDWNDNKVYNGYDFIQKWSYSENYLTVDLYKQFDYYGSVDTDSTYAEAELIDLYSQGVIQLSLDGSFTNNQLINVHNVSYITFYQHIESVTDFSGWNVAPIVATIKNYKVTLNYNFTEIYP